MARLAPHSSKGQVTERPVLHLDGPVLKEALERLVKGSETVGGMERLLEALRLKSELFRGTLDGGKAGELTADRFQDLSALMATCRRRVAAPLREHGFDHFHVAIQMLLTGVEDTGSADQRIAEFVARFPSDKTYRWTRDMAAEILHFTYPELYPLTTRWVWDVRTNTGALREMWHGDDVDHIVIDVGDGFETGLMLREELAQFLTDNGIYRETLFSIDLLLAQVYAEYIEAQGGTYLRADFATPGDPLEHVRRILGLDGVSPKSGRSRFKTIDGDAQAVDMSKPN